MQLLMQYRYLMIAARTSRVWLYCFCQTAARKYSTILGTHLPGLKVPAFPTLVIANNF